MIEDPILDNYNRIITYFLFLRYSDYLEDEKIQKSLNRLQTSIDKLPLFLKEKISRID